MISIKLLARYSLIINAVLFSLAVLPATAAPETAEKASVLEKVKNTRVGLIPPAGFKPSPLFNGFILEEKHASIMVTELPAPAEKMIEGFTAENLAKKNMELLGKESVKVAGSDMEGQLLHVKQKVAGVSFEKWITIFGDDNSAVLVVAAFPEGIEEDVSAALKKSVSNIEWDAKLKLDQTAGLNFEIEPAGPLKLARRIQNMLLFTEEGKFPAKSASDPIFIVGQSFANPHIPDREKFCVDRIKQMTGLSDFSDLHVVSLGSDSKDDADGFEVVAQAVDSKSGDKMFIYQVIHFAPDSYYIQQGMVTDNRRKELEPVFRKMSGSFKPKS